MKTTEVEKLIGKEKQKKNFSLLTFFIEPMSHYMMKKYYILIVKQKKFLEEMIILTVFSDWIGPMIGLGASGLIVFLIYHTFPYIVDFFDRVEEERIDIIHKAKCETEIYENYKKEFGCKKVPLEFAKAVRDMSVYGTNELNHFFQSKFSDKEKLVKDVLSGDFEGIVDKYIGGDPYDFNGLRKYYDIKKKQFFMEKNEIIKREQLREKVLWNIRYVVDNMYRDTKMVRSADCSEEESFSHLCEESKVKLQDNIYFETLAADDFDVTCPEFNAYMKHVSDTAKNVCRLFEDFPSNTVLVCMLCGHIIYPLHDVQNYIMRYEKGYE